jgi:chromatin modification-related protein EAF6
MTEDPQPASDAGKDTERHAQPNGTSAQPSSGPQDDLPSTVKRIDSAEERAALQQRYQQSRTELKSLITRKKQADRDLAALESQIYKLETAYLEETQQGGNLVRGFDGYLKGVGNTRKSTFNEADRLFSLSSVSFSEAATGVVGSGQARFLQAHASTAIPNMPYPTSRRDTMDASTPASARRTAGSTKRRKENAATPANGSEGESDSEGSANGDAKRSRVSYVS